MTRLKLLKPHTSSRRLSENCLRSTTFPRSSRISSVYESIQAPVEEGQILGTMTISYEGEVLGTMDLVACTSVEGTAFL